MPNTSPSSDATAHSQTSEDAPSDQPGLQPPRSARVLGALLLITIICTLLLTRSGHIDLAAQDFFQARLIPTELPAPVTSSDTLRASSAPPFTPHQLPTHPDVAHREYMNPSLLENEADSSSLAFQFRQLLDLYEKRQGVDDNFTLRVFDSRTGEVLELYTLEDERAAYERGAPVDWPAIDRKRRRLTRKLVDKYEARGIPKKAIGVRWGRANQVQEAHEKDRPYVEYEMRLARYLGLSLLPTEIGTVETFNQDHLVSAVGARSRYQMMPFILRRNGLHRYGLHTPSGHSVRVRDERHPLLTMGPAFFLIRGYVNAVGHELPGISAYHTGPGNIYKIYRLFLTESTGRVHTSSNVMDAYMWAVTEGFDFVSENSTFGPHSRGYVASAYGALRAIDHEIVDTTQTVRTARVQLKSGTSITLRRLLDTLRTAEASLDWGPDTARLDLYGRFRALNPHIDLPEHEGNNVPDAANVRLVPSINGKAVRFFLPLEAPALLDEAGLDVIDDAATFRFDTNTYAPPAPSERTQWDRAYDDLVDDIAQFGFTERNRERLLTIHEQFERLAEETPSRFRLAQLRIIETHRRLWLSNPWETLADATTTTMGQIAMPVQPPTVLETAPPLLATPEQTGLE